MHFSPGSERPPPILQYFSRLNVKLSFQKRPLQICAGVRGRRVLQAEAARQPRWSFFQTASCKTTAPNSVFPTMFAKSEQTESSRLI